MLDEYWEVRPHVSLRKSPTLTPALLAAHRSNAKQSTGPHTARGKAWSRLNHLKTGSESPAYRNFLDILMNAPPGQMTPVAEALRRGLEVPHPRFGELAELAVQAEIDICADARLQRAIWE
jgi:hypothetical protein